MIFELDVYFYKLIKVYSRKKISYSIIVRFIYGRIIARMRDDGIIVGSMLDRTTVAVDDDVALGSMDGYSLGSIEGL